MERILQYAKRQGYTEYTSTLVEAWRVSIAGLSDALTKALALNDAPLELHPDDDFRHDPVAEYGIQQARNHRTRGLTIEMFLGLMKYYRQSYQDLVAENVAQAELREAYRLYLERFFDRIEIGFCGEWAGRGEAAKITELQSANRRLTNEKNLYLTIFESLFSPVLLLNTQGQIVNLNHRAKELFTSSSSPGSGYYSPLETLQLDWLEDLLAVAEHQDTQVRELFLPTRTGDRLFEIRLKRMLDISGKFTGTVVMLRDLTELREAEQERSTAFTELQRSNLELENFAYIASHDLQEPLRMITSYLQLLDRRYHAALDDSGKEFIEFAVDGAQRMRVLIDDLLNYSRIGRNREERTQVDLQEVAAQVLKNMQVAIADCGARIEIDPLPTVEANESQMVQLLQNLLSNAIKFRGDKAPHIQIRVAEQPAFWAFSVQDDGIGIDSQHHERIFKIFQRLHGKEDYPGTGIGLAQCQKIVYTHGGEIHVESSPGNGATFHFTLRKAV